MEIAPLSSQDLAVRPIRQAGRTDATGFASQFERAQSPAVKADVLPSSPPADVLAEVERAAQRVEELAQANRQLHFEKDPNSGRIIVQVQDLDGKVLRTIPPSSALDVMSGAGL